VIPIGPTNGCYSALKNHRPLSPFLILPWVFCIGPGCNIPTWRWVEKQHGTGLTVCFKDQQGCPIRANGLMLVQRESAHSPRAGDHSLAFEVVDIEIGCATIPVRKETKTLMWGWYYFPACHAYPADTVHFVPLISGYFGSAILCDTDRYDAQLDCARDRPAAATEYWENILILLEKRALPNHCIETVDFERLKAFIDTELSILCNDQVTLIRTTSPHFLASR